MANKNPADYVIIDDGAFRYPMLRSDLGGETLESLRAMSGDEYSLWCQDHPHSSDNEVGTQECIDMCTALADGGAEVWYIAGPK